MCRYSEVSNEDSAINFFQTKNVLLQAQKCDYDHEMIIKGSRWRCQRRTCRKETKDKNQQLAERFKITNTYNSILHILLGL